MANRATVTFHTTPEIKARLDRLASITRRSKSFHSNAAVESYLEAEEDFVASVQAGLSEADAGLGIETSEIKERLYKFINDRVEKNKTT